MKFEYKETTVYQFLETLQLNKNKDEITKIIQRTRHRINSRK